MNVAEEDAVVTTSSRSAEHGRIPVPGDAEMSEYEQRLQAFVGRELDRGDLVPTRSTGP